MNGELRSVIRAIDSLSQRIARLEEQNRFTASADWAQASWWGWCSTTQPVSRIVSVRGGYLWEWDSAAGTAKFRRLDGATYDFSTFPAFAEQYHYRWAVIRADVSVSPVVLSLFDSGVEFGTSGECEADFLANGPAEDLYGAYIPLCAVALRNSGDLVVSGAVENVTLSDRTKSFIMVRDLRPWLHLHKT